jgi:alpha-beta hydrolase superfamily lysophospholipase
MVLPKISVNFLQQNGVKNSMTRRYYHTLRQLREKIHPNQPLCPYPAEHYFRQEDGNTIFIQEFIPKQIKALLICQHGNNVTSDLFYTLADHLYSYNIGLAAIDNRGHGRSGPGRGMLSNPFSMVQVYSSILQKYQKLPCHLLGESLGCIMIASFLCKSKKRPQNLKSILLQVPPYRLHPDHFLKPINAILRVLLSIIQILTFNRPIFPNKPGELGSFLPEFHKLDLIDPIRNPRIGAIHLKNDLLLLKEFAKFVPSIRYPTLILQGTADQMLSIEGTIDLFRSIPHSQKELKLYPKASHSLFIDVHSQQIYKDIHQWLVQF